MADDWTNAILKYSPKNARKAWLKINSTVLAFCIVLLVEIFLTLEPPDRLEGTRAYLSYNLIVCFSWTVESGLHFLQYRHDQKEKEGLPREELPQEEQNSNEESSESQSNNEFYYLVGELLLAVYFLYDSVSTFSDLWRHPDANIAAQLFDVLIDTAAYAYLTSRVFLSPEKEESDGVDTGAETTPYVGGQMA